MIPRGFIGGSKTESSTLFWETFWGISDPQKAPPPYSRLTWDCPGGFERSRGGRRPWWTFQLHYEISILVLKVLLPKKQIFWLQKHMFI